MISESGQPASDSESAADAEALGDWLLERVGEFVPPLEVSHLSGGRSNLTLLLRDTAGRRLVLRRPPLGELAASAHDVLRECRIVDALARNADLPLARPVAWCEDVGVIGAPFWIMEYVGGTAVADPAAAARMPPAVKSRFGDELATLLAELHSRAPDALGLGDLVRSGGYLERQLRRWGGQLAARSKLSSDLFAPVQSLLEQRLPDEGESMLLHGDFKPGNVLVDPDGGICAIVDWELAAVGDPLADLGWLLASWAEPGEGEWIVPPATSAGGFSGRGGLVDTYARISGRDVSQIAYYVAFADWRWSCINEGILDRIRTGALSSASVPPSRVERQIAWQLERALQLLSGPAGAAAMELVG